MSDLDEEYLVGEVTPLFAQKKFKNPIKRCKSYFSEKRIDKFYEKQSDLLLNSAQDKNVLNSWENAVALKDEAKIKQRKLESLLARTTFGINVLLLIAKVTAAILSGSLSVVSTVVDSAVDITSGLVIWMTVRAIEHRDPYEYPRGRSKLEPLAVVIVGIIMGVANIIVIVIAIQNIIQITVDPKVEITTMVLLIGASGVKAVLLFFCLKLGTSNGKILAADQRNDIVTNLVALACALLGHYVWIYSDPIGAIIVCTYIAISWFYMAADQIPLLSGKSAKPEMINRIIRICVDHDARIKCLDTVLVYHYGERFLCEVHVVMDENMTLKDSHNIAEPLQKKLESLDYVERAFVHCDYEADGFD